MVDTTLVVGLGLFALVITLALASMWSEIRMGDRRYINPHTCLTCAHTCVFVRARHLLTLCSKLQLESVHIRAAIMRIDVHVYAHASQKEAYR